MLLVLPLRPLPSIRQYLNSVTLPLQARPAPHRPPRPAPPTSTLTTHPPPLPRPPQVLWPADAAYDLPEPTGECVHTVAPGDTLWALAEKYGTTAAALIEINPALEKGGGAALAIGGSPPYPPTPLNRAGYACCSKRARRAPAWMQESGSRDYTGPFSVPVLCASSQGWQRCPPPASTHCMHAATCDSATLTPCQLCHAVGGCEKGWRMVAAGMRRPDHATDVLCVRLPSLPHAGSTIVLFPSCVV